MVPAAVDVLDLESSDGLSVSLSVLGAIRFVADGEALLCSDGPFLPVAGSGGEG